MYRAKNFIDVKNSHVIPRWRTDQVEVNWIL